jgi:hypothetical protein
MANAFEVTQWGVWQRLLVPKPLDNGAANPVNHIIAI